MRLTFLATSLSALALVSCGPHSATPAGVTPDEARQLNDAAMLDANTVGANVVIGNKEDD